MFNLEEDPQELVNLSGMDPKRELRMREQLLDWLIETEIRPNSL